MKLVNDDNKYNYISYGDQLHCMRDICSFCNEDPLSPKICKETCETQEEGKLFYPYAYSSFNYHLCLAFHKFSSLVELVNWTTSH